MLSKTPVMRRARCQARRPQRLKTRKSQTAKTATPGANRKVPRRIDQGVEYLDSIRRSNDHVPDHGQGDRLYASKVERRGRTKIKGSSVEWGFPAAVSRRRTAGNARRPRAGHPPPRPYPPRRHPHLPPSSATGTCSRTSSNTTTLASPSPSSSSCGCGCAPAGGLKCVPQLRLRLRPRGRFEMCPPVAIADAPPRAV